MRVEAILFEASNWVPNNPELPVLLYHQAIADEADLATAFEKRFAENGWEDCWRNGVFSYQHYHTGAHEVLGIARGEARLLIGGTCGRQIDVSAGDCIACLRERDIAGSAPVRTFWSSALTRRTRRRISRRRQPARRICRPSARYLCLWLTRSKAIRVF